MQHAIAAGHMTKVEAQALSLLTSTNKMLARFWLYKNARLRHDSANCSHYLAVAYLVQQVRKRNPLTIWSLVADIKVKYFALLLVIYKPGVYRLDKCRHST